MLIPPPDRPRALALDAGHQYGNGGGRDREDERDDRGRFEPERKAAAAVCDPLDQPADRELGERAAQEHPRPQPADHDQGHVLAQALIHDLRRTAYDRAQAAPFRTRYMDDRATLRRFAIADAPKPSAFSRGLRRLASPTFWYVQMSCDAVNRLLPGSFRPS